MDMRLSLGHKSLLVIAILYTSALTIGSLMRPVHIVNAPISNIDKLLHAGAYFGLTILWFFWFLFKHKEKVEEIKSKMMWKICVGVVIAAIFYGVLMEVLQGTITTYRTPDSWDILANTTGSILALIACLLYINKSKMLKSKF